MLLNIVCYVLQLDCKQFVAFPKHLEEVVLENDTCYGCPQKGVAKITIDENFISAIYCPQSINYGKLFVYGTLRMALTNSRQMEYEITRALNLNFSIINYKTNQSQIPQIVVHDKSYIEQIKQLDRNVTLTLADSHTIIRPRVVIKNIIGINTIYMDNQIKLTTERITNVTKIQMYESAEMNCKLQIDCQELYIYNYSVMQFSTLVADEIVLYATLRGESLISNIILVQHAKIKITTANIGNMTCSSASTIVFNKLKVNYIKLESLISVENIELLINEQMNVYRFMYTGMKINCNINTLIIENQATANINGVFKVRILKIENQCICNFDYRVITDQIQQLTIEQSMIIFEKQVITLKIAELIIKNSSFLSKYDVEIDNLYGNNSEVLIIGFLKVNLNTTFNNTQIHVHNKTSFTFGSAINTNLTTNAFELLDVNISEDQDRKKTTFSISTIILPYIQYTPEQQNIIDKLSYTDQNTQEYQELIKQTMNWSGLLIINSKQQLQCESINASIIYLYGRIRYIKVQTPIVIFSSVFFIFENQESLQLNIQVQKPPNTNMTQQVAYIRSQRVVLISNLFLFDSDLFILQGPNIVTKLDEQVLFKVMNQLEIMNSQVTTKYGELAFLTENLQIQQIQYLNSDIRITPTSIYADINSVITAGKLRAVEIAGGDSITVKLNGKLNLNNDDVYFPGLHIVAKQVTINQANVFGQRPNNVTRQGSCCGSSSVNFGGCSEGIPQNQIKYDKNVQLIKQLSGLSGDTCFVNSEVVRGGVSGGSISIQSEVVYLNGMLSTSGVKSQEMTTEGQNYSYCGGSGSGGSIYIKTDILYYNGSNSIISSNGAGCSPNCTTGGAGSAGYVFLLYNKIQNIGMQKNSTIVKVEQINGECQPFPISKIYCQSMLTTLDEKTMTCMIPFWVVLCIVLSTLILICFIIYISMCLTTRFRSKQTDKSTNGRELNHQEMQQFIIDERMLYELQD